MTDAPIANEGFFVTHFFTVRGQEKSKDFYVRILGGKVIKSENPCYIKLVNTWIILNSGGGPTPDKPDVILEPLSDRNRATSFLNLRVADIWACYKEWGDREPSSLPSRWTIMAGSGAAICAIPTATSLRSANIPRWRSPTLTSLLAESLLIPKTLQHGAQVKAQLLHCL